MIGQQDGKNSNNARQRDVNEIRNDSNRTKIQTTNTGFEFSLKEVKQN